MAVEVEVVAVDEQRGFVAVADAVGDASVGGRVLWLRWEERMLDDVAVRGTWLHQPDVVLHLLVRRDV